MKVSLEYNVHYIWNGNTIQLTRNSSMIPLRIDSNMIMLMTLFDY